LARIHPEFPPGAGIGNRNLVARQNENTAPRRYRVAVHVNALWIDALAVAFPAEGRDRMWMGEEISWIFPHRRQQLVQIIRRRRLSAGVYSLDKRRVVQRPEVRVVDEFVFPAFA
jgi:hypothetical protein